MLIRKSVQQFFKVRPEFSQVPPVVQRPGRKLEIAWRPPSQPEGNELFLIAKPSVRQLRVQIISKMVFSQLSTMEKEILLTLLPMFSLKPDSDTIMENILFRDFSSEFIPEKELERFSEEAEARGLLTFIPTRALSRMKTELLTVRRWRSRPKVIFPQRKRGYDDKGTLAPPGSINWREIAQVTSDEPLNFGTAFSDNFPTSDRSDFWEESRLTMAARESLILEAETFVEEFLNSQGGRK